MNFLLLLFALPIAIVIIASVIETVLRNPLAVAALAFAIYLIVAFSAFDATFLIYVILYTILAYISAVVTRTVISMINDEDDSSCNSNDSNCGCNSRCYRYR